MDETESSSSNNFKVNYDKNNTRISKVPTLSSNNIFGTDQTKEDKVTVYM
jgi:hypothetical protein